jgi:DNA modification methylase
MIEKADAQNLFWANSNSADLVLSSLPIPNSFEYIQNYWLENWFGGFNDKAASASSLSDWTVLIKNSLSEMLRVLKPNSHAVLELSVESSGKYDIKNLENIVIREAQKLSVHKKKFCIKEVAVHVPTAAKYEQHKNNQQKFLIFQVC